MRECQLVAFLSVLAISGIGIQSEPISALKVCLSGSQREIGGRTHWTRGHCDLSICDVIYPGGFHNREHLHRNVATMKNGGKNGLPFLRQENKRGGALHEDTGYTVTTKDPDNNLVQLVTDEDCQSWHTYDEHHYCFINSKKTWTDANQKCRSYLSSASSHLVYIESMDENIFVKKFFEEMKVEKETYVWIGLDDISEEGNFKWGLKAANFTNWLEETGEPNGGKPNIPDEDCAIMSTLDQGKWLDFQCMKQIHSICEAEV